MLVEVTKRSVPTAVRLKPMAGSRVVVARQVSVGLRLSVCGPLAKHRVDLINVGFHRAVALRSMRLKGIPRRRLERPNVEVTGAAQLYRAASVWTAGLGNGDLEDSTRRPASADF